MVQVRYDRAMQRRNHLLDVLIKRLDDEGLRTVQKYLLSAEPSDEWAKVDVPLGLRKAQEELIAASKELDGTGADSHSDAEAAESQGSML